jgi:uncharacterized protein YifN (PemK superfamily)
MIHAPDVTPILNGIFNFSILSRQMQPIEIIVFTCYGLHSIVFIDEVETDDDMPLPNGIRPSPGQVLMCDFGPDPDNIVPPGVMTGPLAVKPEIYKQRQTVVINASSGLTTVVPLSTVAPRSPMKIHYRIAAGFYGFLDQNDDSWVKADLITTVSNQRLDRPFVAGQRKTVSVSKYHMLEIRKTVLHALAMSALVSTLDPDSSEF